MKTHSWMDTGYRTRLRCIPLLASLVLTVFCFAAWQSAVAQGPTSSTGKVLLVDAAADMEPVFQVAGPIFERQTGYKLKVSFASSAALAQQIQNGSPADIFFSADYYFAEQVVASNLTDTKQPTPYAKGLLVLWAPKNSRFQPLNLDVLTRKDLGKVAVANPDRAPYGRAASAALNRLKYMANVQSHIVQSESVAQAAQFALSGNADVALISQTIAMSPKYKNTGNFVLFPLDQYPEIRQCAVVLKKGHDVDGAHRLLKFMLSDQVQSHLKDLGLQPIQ